MKKAKIASTTMLGANSVSSYTATYQRTIQIPHGISGVIPFARVYYEPYRDGRITAAYDDSQDWLADPANDYGGYPGNAPICCYWVDSVNINIQLRYIDNSQAALSFPIHVIAYRDFGVA